MGLAVLPVLGIAALAFWVSYQFSGDRIAVNVTVTAIVAIASLIFSMVILRRRFGFMRLRQSNAQETTLKLLDKIRAGKGRNAGIALLKCEEAFWRDVVTLCMQRADAIVIDVTDPSENVLRVF